MIQISDSKLAELTESARRLLAEGKATEAWPLLQECLSVRPWSPALRLLSARAAMGAGETARAEALLAALVAERPDMEAAKRLHAQARAAGLKPPQAAARVRVLLAEGKPQEATALVDEALALRPTNAALRLLAARTAIYAGQRDRARELLTALVADQPQMGAAKRLLDQLAAGETEPADDEAQ